MRRNTEKNSHILEEGEATLLLEQGNLKGDEKNIAILLILYILQGIPIGLSAAIPMILQKYGVSYKQQAEFSFVIWPFSLKLFWAPIVDTLYLPKFGRRKTWLLPAQYLMGFFMLFLSMNVDSWLSNKENLSVTWLTVLFFILNLLAATQDIAVDGWALTMLKRRNVTHASTCNTVGQTTGYFLGYVIFLALESPNFCNSYLRSVPQDSGMITLPEFLYFWGWVFIIVTTLIGIFKHEKPEIVPKGKDNDMSVMHAYKLLWRIVNLSNIKNMLVITLTAKIGFAACDAVTSLKMVENGMPKEKLALMAVPLIPVQIILPLFLSKYTVGPTPLAMFLKAYPYRLGFGLVAAFLVWITPSFVHDQEVSAAFLILIVVLYFFHQLATTSMYVASMAFYARISDPALGGTYMSFLNTITNLGGNWPSTAALWFVDSVTFRRCSTDPNNDCSSPETKEACAANNKGTCTILWDGYYILSIVCMIIGWFWLRWARSRIIYLQGRHQATWKIKR